MSKRLSIKALISAATPESLGPDRTDPTPEVDDAATRRKHVVVAEARRLFSRSEAELAKAFGVNPTSIRGWVKRAAGYPEGRHLPASTSRTNSPGWKQRRQLAVAEAHITYGRPINELASKYLVEPVTIWRWVRQAVDSPAGRHLASRYPTRDRGKDKRRKPPGGLPL